MKNHSTLSSLLVVAAGFASAGSVRAQEKISYIDLAPLANRKLSDNLGSGAEENSLSELPTGEQVLGGIKFQVGPGLIQLGSKLMESYPDKIEGIAVNRKLTKLHLLHATCYGGGPNEEGGEGYVKDGTLIGQYVVHYDDGGSEGIPIVYGQDVRDWWYVEGEREPSQGKVVWKGDNGYATAIGAHLRLYTSAWANPKPDKKITRIDYVSHKNATPAAPFCIAISVEVK